MASVRFWQFLLLMVINSFLCLSVIAQDDTRADDRCGPDNLAPNGEPAKCKNIPPFPTCCQKNGHCGWDCDGIATNDDIKNGALPKPVVQVTEKPIYVSNGRYRSDGRCGPTNPLEDGITPAECDPNSGFYCCSAHGFCGSEEEHCYCDTCVNYRPIKIDGKVRSDRRCGAEFPLDDGTPAECNPNSENPCCSKWGYCGPGDSHCACPDCIDYRTSSDINFQKEIIIPFDTARVRSDRRCGAKYPMKDGSPSECDPNGPNPCCSEWNYCGPGSDHCDCPNCVDFRSAEQKSQEDFVGKVRKDRRCGAEFPLPNSKEPSECDPQSENFCCSKWGYCGFDADHCDCEECVNYQNVYKK